jgi:hypothetical protein
VAELDPDLAAQAVTMAVARRVTVRSAIAVGTPATETLAIRGRRREARLDDPRPAVDLAPDALAATRSATDKSDGMA